LQALLDHTQFEQIFSSLNIRHQAKLTALSHSSGASSGWLKVIPQVSLALAIPGPEFEVAMRLWLGIPLFPLSPLCLYLTSIDQFVTGFWKITHMGANDTVNI